MDYCCLYCTIISPSQDCSVCPMSCCPLSSHMVNQLRVLQWDPLTHLYGPCHVGPQIKKLATVCFYCTAHFTPALTWSRFGALAGSLDKISALECWSPRGPPNKQRSALLHCAAADHHMFYLHLEQWLWCEDDQSHWGKHIERFWGYRSYYSANEYVGESLASHCSVNTPRKRCSCSWLKFPSSSDATLISI